MLPCVEKVHDELDNQEVHLRRLARRIDALQGQRSAIELQVSRAMHQALEQMYATWEDDPPPGWPDATTNMLSRTGAQRHAIELLAEQVESMGADIDSDEIRRDLDHGSQRIPVAMESHFHGVPLVARPQDLERDFYELIFDPRQEALLKIDAAVDELSGKQRGPSAPG